MIWTKEKMRKLVEVKPTQPQIEMRDLILKDVFRALDLVRDGCEVNSVSVSVGTGLDGGLTLAKAEFAKQSDLDWAESKGPRRDTVITLSWGD